MKPLTIGQVAQRSEVGIETIRFYEREGVLEKPNRSESGYRLYEEGVIARLRFVGKAKELGFTLKEIKELLSLQIDPTTTCVDVKRCAEEKLSDIESKIRTLQKMKKSLVKLTKQCISKGPTSECPLLNALEPRRNT